MTDESDFVLIGLVRRAHGIAGEVLVEPVSDIPGRFEALEAVLMRQRGEMREVEVDSVRWKSKSLLIKLRGIDDRTAAQAHSGAMLGVRQKDVHPVPKDAYYVFDIEGCEVVGESGRKIGVVGDVLKLPANDVFVVKTDGGEVLVPVVKSVVKRIDLDSKTIEIEEIEGLLG